MVALAIRSTPAITAVSGSALSAHRAAQVSASVGTVFSVRARYSSDRRQRVCKTTRREERDPVVTDQPVPLLRVDPLHGSCCHYCLAGVAAPRPSRRHRSVRGPYSRGAHRSTGLSTTAGRRRRTQERTSFTTPARGRRETRSVSRLPNVVCCVRQSYPVTRGTPWTGAAGAAGALTGAAAPGRAAAAAPGAPGWPGGVTGAAAQPLSLVSLGLPGPPSSPPAPRNLDPV